MEIKKPILTIGMACYNNVEQVWWTIMSLRLYHDLSDCEIIVVDNYGSGKLKDWCECWGAGLIKYIERKEIRGTAHPRNEIFKNASGKFVLCIDSHVMITPGSISGLKNWALENDSDNLFHGIMMYDGLNGGIDGMTEEWKSHFFGVWNQEKKAFPLVPYEIAMHGMGLFGCFKDKWLGFNSEFVGFGGEEGYIHKKYRKFGKKVFCLPWLKWVHRFHDQITPLPYQNVIEERIRNYVIGWNELGLDLQEIRDAFPGYQIDFTKAEEGNLLNIKHN